MSSETEVQTPPPPPLTATGRSYLTREVCELTGMSYRQAHYLAPFVGLPRIGPGQRWTWTPLQIMRAWAINRLLRCGFDRATAAPLAHLLEPGDVFLVVPVDHEAFTTTDALDVVDGLSSEVTTVVRVPGPLLTLG